MGMSLNATQTSLCHFDLWPSSSPTPPGVSYPLAVGHSGSIHHKTSFPTCHLPVWFPNPASALAPSKLVELTEHLAKEVLS